MFLAELAVRCEQFRRIPWEFSRLLKVSGGALGGRREQALRNAVLRSCPGGVCLSLCPSLPVQSLPPLEWPLCSQSGPYELRIEVQPKPHHRAHYETEGSRGAVKAPTGGHPVVQVRPGGPLHKKGAKFISEMLAGGCP